MGLLTLPHWFSNVPWLHVYLGFSLSVECFEQYLNTRQLKRYDAPKPPAKLAHLVTEEEYAKSNAYNKDKMRFGIFSSLFQTSISLISTACFLGPYLWRLAGTLVGKNGNEYTQSLVDLALSAVIGECISTPFQLYGDFVVEEKHGFNKKTLALFFKDKLLSLGLTSLIGGPVAYAAIWLINVSVLTQLWGFSVATVIAMMFIYPNLIAPLFNKFEPLKDEELRGKICDLAKKLDFPLTKLYEMDNSKRSGHSNAYFYGFWWSKRIVLYDTLLHLPHDQILAILGHEMGHWKKNHTTKMMAVNFLQLFCTLYLFGLVMGSDALFDSFGYTDTRASVVGLKLFSNIFLPVNTLISLMMTIYSRKNEFEADAFACELGYSEPLKQGLVAIHAENKSCLDPDPWFSFWHYSHPPLLERLRAIEAIQEKEEKEN
ncbi:putative peptidase family M48 domain-containing protein [Neospora caninum Liverpool]|uniref:CAAX prenyl protease n=1 Tax=Neospora caninum (strain Liverpool) TaxID=572307 RepID=F0V8F7_NEOCL|nr:putative peptidase family M48 domain-containing protein [Neospora caninum Liverpool]CBZ49998.1 putative peptidase family M48 domain-containing protein [Neospora caninum Liverpool]|eukprot:XP_003880033.1 putative peptidase family M48 domain-containing protein [Neospora caninum Liverpool]